MTETYLCGIDDVKALKHTDFVKNSISNMIQEYRKRRHPVYQEHANLQEDDISWIFGYQYRKLNNVLQSRVRLIQANTWTDVEHLKEEFGIVDPMLEIFDPEEENWSSWCNEDYEIECDLYKFDPECDFIRQPDAM
jgi:hypothetical protein